MIHALLCHPASAEIKGDTKQKDTLPMALSDLCFAIV